MLPFFDSHAHLYSLGERGIDTATLLEQLFSQGFSGIIDIGTEAGDLAERRAALAVWPLVYFSVGIWPSEEAISDRARCLDKLRADLDDPMAISGIGFSAKAIAIGECGLDRHWNQAENGADLAGERELFASQAALALERRLPIIVHSREAAIETRDVLACYPGLRGVIHCYGYGPEEIKAFLDLGFYISFAGNITYKNAQALREALRRTPLNRLLLETDSPYLAPTPYRGKTNHPGLISETYKTAAALIDIEEKALTSLVKKNADALFGFPDTH